MIDTGRSICLEHDFLFMAPVDEKEIKLRFLYNSLFID